MQIHHQFLQNCKKTESPELSYQALQAQFAKVTLVSRDLDGSSLELLKQETKKLYERCLQFQLCDNSWQEQTTVQAFIFRICEQEPLSVADLQAELPHALNFLLDAIKRRNALKAMELLGGILGGVFGSEGFALLKP